MEECLVSIIIPVYNVEEYLRKCLDSAINQTLTDIEIVVINDGSTDSCPYIIDEYAKKDKRIHVINQENQGLSEARNAGIRKATGEYLSFMDSDDWMDIYFIEKMYMTAKKTNTEIVICNHAKVIKGEAKISSSRHFKSDVIVADDALRMIISDSGIQSFAWNKLYRSNLFASNNIFYPKGLYFEDIATTFKLFYYAKTVGLVNDCLYYYLLREKSITKKHNPKRVFDNITAITIMKEFFIKEGVFEKYSHEFQYLCVKMLISTVFNLTMIYNATREPGLFDSMQSALKTIRSLMVVK